MIPEEVRVLIRRRVQQAAEAVDDAAFLLEQGRVRATVNRAYYAMFYGVLALLQLAGKGTSKHTGVIALFDREFVKSGQFPQQLSSWLHEAFAWRQRVDYEVLAAVSREEAAALVGRARVFLEQVGRYLAPHLTGGSPS